MTLNKNLLTLSLPAAFAVMPGTSYAQTTVESAFVRFQGADLTDDLFAVAASTTAEIIGEPGQGNLTGAQMSGTFIKSNAPNEKKTAQVTSLERRASVSLTQTFDKLTSAGVTYGYTSSSYLSRWYSLKVGQWWNKATISTDLEYTKTDANRAVIDRQDTDFARIWTPSNVRGDKYTLSLTWLATTHAMILGSIATNRASDRPTANAGSIEGRYFFDATLTAVHLKGGFYDDTAATGVSTDYGRISSREWEAQVHQHLNDQFIATVALREHFETESPRADTNPVIHRHSRATQVRLRDRFVTGPVTDQVSEIYVFAGQYGSFDQMKTINHFGLGGIYVL
jgi:hypothetical protein